MTAERCLAIQMWKEIREALPYWHEVDTRDLATTLRAFKQSFCYHHDLEWLFNCWFCAYTLGVCARCPLHSCNPQDLSTAWARIVNEKSSIETRVTACNEIIKALGGNPND